MPTDKKQSQSHYDTLGLKQNCTEKEIKNAFLALSKAHHPDFHLNDPSQKEKFVEIYEAYSVLSRPHRRLVYDTDLRYRERTRSQWNSNGTSVETDAPHYTTWKDESLWGMRDRSSENFDKNKPYYGIKGVNRVSNYWIAGGAVVVMMLGALMHYVAFKHSATFTVTKLDTKDEKNARQLFKSKQNAKINGNDLQLKLFHEKFGWSEEMEQSNNDTNDSNS